MKWYQIASNFLAQEVDTLVDLLNLPAIQKDKNTNIKWGNLKNKINEQEAKFSSIVHETKWDQILIFRVIFWKIQARMMMTYLACISSTIFYVSCTDHKLWVKFWPIIIVQ